MNYRNLTNLHEEYELLSTNDSIVGTVQNMKKYKGTSFIVINDRKIIIGASSNEIYSTQNINDLMQIGDSIMKNSNSDTIYLYHKNRNYYFVHDKVINNEW